MAVRGAEGREASPSAGVIDSQPAFAEAKLRLRAGRSVKTTESGGPRGFDAGKLIKGRKYRILTDTGGYAGSKLRGALARIDAWTLEIVKRWHAATGFTVLPRRWVVERTLAWLNRNRRLAKDLETTSASAEAWLYIASVQLITRRLARV